MNLNGEIKSMLIIDIVHANVYFSITS